MAKITLTHADEGPSVDYYLAEVDRCAEQARRKLITPGPGQTMTYEQKYREALNGGGAFLDAEAEALGLTVEEVAGSVLDARNRWEALGARIEATRLRAKRAIRNSASVTDMHEIVRGLDFPE